MFHNHQLTHMGATQALCKPSSTCKDTPATQSAHLIHVEAPLPEARLTLRRQGRAAGCLPVPLLLVLVVLLLL